jgi:plastocyanin
MRSSCRARWRPSDVKAILFCLASLLALPALAAETHVITIEGMKFALPTVTVKKGDKVVWQNKDIVPHTVTAAGKFDSGEIKANGSWTWTAQAPGRYDYTCTYHPTMKGALVVQ